MPRPPQVCPEYCSCPFSEAPNMTSEKCMVDMLEIVRREPCFEIITPELREKWKLPPCNWPWLWNCRGGYLEIAFPEPNNDFGVEVIAQLKTFHTGPYGRIWLDKSSNLYANSTGTLWEENVPSIPIGMTHIEQALDAWGFWGTPEAIKWVEPYSGIIRGTSGKVSPLSMNITPRPKYFG